jgi:transposase InsO family protein
VSDDDVLFGDRLQLCDLAGRTRLERVLADNGNEYRGQRFHETTERLGARITHIHAGRPQTNGHVEALHKTILDECRRPAFARYLFPSDTGLPPRTRPLPRLVQQRPRPPPPPHQRPHPRRHRPRCPQDGDEMSRTRRHISETVQLRHRNRPLPLRVVESSCRNRPEKAWLREMTEKKMIST